MVSVVGSSVAHEQLFQPSGEIEFAIQMVCGDTYSIIVMAE